MLKYFRIMTGVLVCAASTLGVSADTFVLKDGSVLQGTFKWGSEERIAVWIDGNIRELPTDQVISVTFNRPATGTSQPSAPSTSAAASAPAVISAQTRVSVPVGSRILIRLDDVLETGKVNAGDRFSSTLEADVTSGNKVVIPRGSKVYGRVVEEKGAARLAGKPKIVLELTDVNISGTMVPVLTVVLGFEGKQEAGATATKIGAGALIGAVLDGKEGAAKGAGVGAGVALVGKGKELQLKPGTVLEFRLRQPLNLVFESR